MENSLKGVLITLTLAGLFITAVLSFIVLFPQEQGVSFASLQDNQTYLTISNLNTSIEAQLSNVDENIEQGYNQWDITQGFMGSNTIKQGSLSSAESYRTDIFSTLTIIATQLFDSSSPIIYVLGIFGSLTAGVLVYFLIKWVRQGE